MNVLYEISALALGIVKKEQRTGIARVVENVAFGLARSPECSLRLCMTRSPVLYWAAEQYIRDEPALAGARFVMPPVAASWAYRRLMPPRESYRSGNAAEGAMASYHRLFLAAGRRLTQSLYPSVGDKELAEADIFHSPLFEVPRQVRVARRVKKFLTVHDLIAIRRPELFGNHLIAMLRRIIDSLRPDDWVLSVSQATKDDLCDYRKDLDPRRVVVVRLAASEQFRPDSDVARQQSVRQKYGIAPDVPYFLTLNTLEPRKNLESVVRAFRRVVEQEHIADLRLVLAGGKGWKIEALTREIDNSPGLRDRIVVTGFSSSAIPTAEVVPTTPNIAQVSASPPPNGLDSTPVHAPAPLRAKPAPARPRSTGPTAAPTKPRANLDPFDDTH